MHSVVLYSCIKIKQTWQKEIFQKLEVRYDGSTHTFILIFYQFSIVQKYSAKAAIFIPTIWCNEEYMHYTTRLKRNTTTNSGQGNKALQGFFA